MTINPFLTVEHATATAIRIAEHSGRRTLVVRGDAERPLAVIFDEPSSAGPNSLDVVLIAEPAPANDQSADAFALMLGAFR